MDLKPYPEARTITLPWLQTIPPHWDVRRIKTLLREHDHRTKTGEERLLSLRMREGIVDHLESGGKPVRPTDLIGYKIVEPGVLIMNRMRASSGLFGVASIGGLVSPDYATFRPALSANTSYLLYLFKTPMLAEVFRAESRGLGTGEAGFLRLYTDRFGAIEIPVPPIEEQRLIVRFLDTHGALTARLIRAKQRLIKLLEEQKQAIIHRAVARGLDQNVRLKPSGIHWLGDVPDGWDVKRLKTEMRFIGGGTPSKAEASYWNGDIPWISPKDMKSDVVDDAEDKITIEAVQRSSTKIVPSGSILMVVRSGILQRTIPVALCTRDVAINHDMKALISKGKILPAYFVLYVRGCEQMLLAEWTKQGATVESIEHQFLADSLVVIPSLEEQLTIVDDILENSSKFNRAISTIENEIALLREYRGRLIADVVTGKFDVRAAALALPEITESEPIDEPTDGEDLEEALDDIENEVVAA